MSIPTPRPDGDIGTLPLPTRMAAAVDDMAYELEMDADGDEDEVWVLSIRLEFADQAE
ncbi:MAG TPA: hypothetical protein VLJ57_20335 [Burkholderiaceae bacterium]|nr:hypothetical protein [Burkholderiaceae bacterium]